MLHGQQTQAGQEFQSISNTSSVTVYFPPGRNALEGWKEHWRDWTSPRGSDLAFGCLFLLH